MIKDFDYEVRERLAESQANQLIQFSLTDPLISKNTNDPIRFSNKDAYKKWLQKGRFVYSLIDTKGNLKGIAWFGIKNPPIHFNDGKEYKYTFAIRLYADARGHGLSKPFMEEVFRKFTKSDEFKNSKEKGIWLETRESNVFALNLYTSFGFTEIDKYQGIVVMILKPKALESPLLKVEGRGARGALF